MARGGLPRSLTPAEAALMRFASAVARDASAVTAADVAELKRHGFTDAEVFDITAVAAGRAFFTKVIESLGVGTDAPLRSLDAEVFDIAAVAAGRAFFTKVIESLGVATDSPLGTMDAALREALTVGRPIRFANPQRLDEPEFRAVG